VGDLSVNLVSREVKRADRNIDLQPMEFSLLEYLMRNAGRVVSRTMIMEHVWNYDFDPRRTWWRQGYADFGTRSTGISRQAHPHGAGGRLCPQGKPVRSVIRWPLD
jgi:hypothetical protein